MKMEFVGFFIMEYKRNEILGGEVMLKNMGWRILGLMKGQEQSKKKKEGT